MPLNDCSSCHLQFLDDGQFFKQGWWFHLPIAIAPMSLLLPSFSHSPPAPRLLLHRPAGKEPFCTVPFPRAPCCLSPLSPHPLALLRVWVAWDLLSGCLGITLSQEIPFWYKLIKLKGVHTRPGPPGQIFGLDLEYGSHPGQCYS